MPADRMSVLVDRRELLLGAAASACVPAVALLPSLRPSLSAAAAVSAPTQADWHIDDQWGGDRVYAVPAGYGRPRPTAPPRVDPVDAAFAAIV